MKKIVYIFLGLSLTLSSCQKWFDGQVVDVELPSHTSVLTVYAFIGAGDSSIDVRVGKSVGALADDNPNLVDGANIRLYRNSQVMMEWSSTPDLQIDTLWYQIINQDTIYYIDSFYVFGRTLDEPFPATLDEYEIEITAPGFETITAVQKLSPKAEIVSATYTPDAAVDNFGDKGDEIAVTIKDEAGVENFYVINVSYQYEWDTTYWQDGYGFSYDPASEEGHRGPIFRDLGFDGQNYAAKVGTYRWDDEKPVKVKVNVVSVSKDYYTFSKSINQYWNADGNPFAEPVVLYSNVQNGLGIFTVHNTVSYIFEP